LIETAEIQGNVLYAYGDRFPFARYVLLRVTHRAQARAILRGWINEITFGRRPWDASAHGESADGRDAPPPPTVRDRPHVNLAFTFAGLHALGVPDEFLYAFPKDFRDGARARSEDNGDVGASSADRWLRGFGTGHVLLFVHAASGDERDRLVDRLIAGSASCMEVLHNLPAARLRSGQPLTARAEDRDRTHNLACDSTLDREHFGFSDGCSQPAIEGIHDDPTGSGVYARTALRWWRPFRSLESLLEDLGLKAVQKAWRPIRAGEFILGYANEDGSLSAGPREPLGPNGTFMVYRPMSQDVDTFDRYVEDEAERLNFLPELIRAKMVGRWRDGTPMTLSPERPSALIAENRRRANDFLYQDDRIGSETDVDGYACPLGAHVRRSNPRDMLPGGGERTLRHRIIRRGMPYGPLDGDGERGLVFVCFSASISSGFEFIQRSWCNSGTELGLGDERDPLLQQGDVGQLSGMVMPAPDGKTVRLDPPPKPFVTVRGCEYLFLPSRRGCEWLMNLS
jgi:Dyp-type peroxidase family